MIITRSSIDTQKGPADWFTGDVVAAPNRLMVHVAMQQLDDAGSAVTWGRHVGDDEYR